MLCGKGNVCLGDQDSDGASSGTPRWVAFACPHLSHPGKRVRLTGGGLSETQGRAPRAHLRREICARSSYLSQTQWKYFNQDCIVRSGWTAVVSSAWCLLWWKIASCSRFLPRDTVHLYPGSGELKFMKPYSRCLAKVYCLAS